VLISEVDLNHAVSARQLRLGRVPYVRALDAGEDTGNILHGENDRREENSSASLLLLPVSSSNLKQHFSHLEDGSHIDYEAIGITAPNGYGQLDELRELWPGLLLKPLIDFTGNNSRAADVGLPAYSHANIAIALSDVAVLRARVASLPGRLRESRDQHLILLARLVTRQKDLEATNDPSVPETISYSAAGPFRDVRSLAESLADQGYLSRTFFDRRITCIHCTSARLVAREICSKCASPRVSEESIIHHFRCAHQDIESKFRISEGLACPKCGDSLCRLGSDYDRPGNVMRCDDCHDVNDEPSVSFQCLDCNGTVPGDDAPFRDCYSYALTERGRTAVNSGGFGLFHPVETSAPSRLAPILEMFERLETHFGRPCVVLEVDVALINGLPLHLTRENEKRLLKVVEDIIRESSRPGDMLVVEHQRLFLLCAEMTESAGVQVAATLGQRLNAILGKYLACGVEVRNARNLLNHIPGVA
jgi:Thaumarchaeal output domain 1